jgi:hypothetical protein
MKQAVALSLVVLLAFSISAAKEHKAMSNKSHTMIGYLVDEACGSKMVMKDVKKSNAKAARHTRDCALQTTCRESGYGLVSGGKFYPFDEKGNKEALEFLENSKKENDLKVKVNGTMEGDKIAVASIMNYKTEKKKKG